MRTLETQNSLITDCGQLPSSCQNRADERISSAIADLCHHSDPFGHLERFNQMFTDSIMFRHLQSMMPNSEHLSDYHYT